MPQKPRIKSIQADPTQVQIWRAPLRAGSPEVVMLRVPVSSLTEDRDGDDFSDRGLQSLARQHSSGQVPVFPNHGMDWNGFMTYRFEDAFGVWVKGEVVDGVEYATAALDPDDYRTMTIERRLQMGLPISWSIGFIPIEFDDKPNGGKTFHEIDLLETSPVGIPSNPDAVSTLRAVVKNMLSKAGITVPDDTDIPENFPGSSESDPVTDKELKEKQPGEGEEEEQEEEKQPESCEEEEKAQEEEPTEDEEEEKSFEVLDESAIRAIVADEMHKAIAPVMERLNALATSAEVKAFGEKVAAAPKAKGPRGIVVAREVEPQQQKNTSTEPAPAYTPLF